MKKLVAIALLVLLLPAGLLCAGASLPDYYSRSYYAELPELYTRLKTTTGKKLVLVGGSNIAFGVDTAQLEQTLRDCGFDYTVCPFGLYAAVGTSVMLELSQSCLGEGDLVVLAMEPTAETLSTYFGANAFWKCAEQNPEMLLGLSSSKGSAAVGSYLGYLQERMEIRRSGILPRPEGVYARDSFDGRGNMQFERAGNTMLLGYDSAAPIDLNVEVEEAFARQVADYCEAARRRGASVVMSFSPMNRGALADASEETVYRYFQTLQSAFPCQIISNPHNYIMDSGWFYDNNFHLNSAGAAIRTHTLACDLLSFLGYYKDIPFDPPLMPDPIPVLPESTGDGGDFTFSPAGEDGWTVSGLTGEGRGKTQLVVPSFYREKPVTGIEADAFAGNGSLEHLVLPETVAVIPDGAFAGCGRLTRLTLLHRTAPPAVGSGLFAGAEGLTVYVPADAYPLYRDGAGCAANPWQQYLRRITSY